MEIQGLKTVNINGKDYWTVGDFAELSQRSDRVIRNLVKHGNRIRKLLAMSIHDRVYIEAEELFNFPFTTGGQPAGMGDYVEKFYIENGELLRKESCLNRESGNE
jgi:hypothetical protein